MSLQRLENALEKNQGPADDKAVIAAFLEYVRERGDVRKAVNLFKFKQNVYERIMPDLCFAIASMATDAVKNVGDNYLSDRDYFLDALPILYPNYGKESGSGIYSPKVEDSFDALNAFFEKKNEIHRMQRMVAEYDHYKNALKATGFYTIVKSGDNESYSLNELDPAKIPLLEVYLSEGEEGFNLLEGVMPVYITIASPFHSKAVIDSDCEKITIFQAKMAAIGQKLVLVKPLFDALVQGLPIETTRDKQGRVHWKIHESVGDYKKYETKLLTSLIQSLSEVLSPNAVAGYRKVLGLNNDATMSEIMLELKNLKNAYRQYEAIVTTLKQEGPQRKVEDDRIGENADQLCKLIVYIEDSGLAVFDPVETPILRADKNATELVSMLCEKLSVIMKRYDEDALNLLRVYLISDENERPVLRREMESTTDLVELMNACWQAVDTVMKGGPSPESRASISQYSFKRSPPSTEEQNNLRKVDENLRKWPNVLSVKELESTRKSLMKNK